MPWLAQRADLPDTHKAWADAGSVLEATYVRLGYVEVPALGAGPVEAAPAPVPAAPAVRRSRSGGKGG